MKTSVVISTHATRFSALAFQEDWARNIAQIAALGYDGVELAIRDPNLLDQGTVARVVAEHRLEVSAIGTGQAYVEDGLSLTAPSADTRRRAIQRLKDHIAFAVPFGAVVIVGLLRGRIVANVHRGQAMTWLREGLRECAAHAAPRGVRLAIEPINRYEADLILTAAEALELCHELAAENVGLLLDTFHMNIEETSLEGAITQAGERLFHFHVADSNRRYPGAGHIRFPALLEVLRQIGYQGYISGEMLPLPDPITAAREMRRYLRSLGI